MPRLRVTATLSLLALLIGTLGTGWLSTFTDDWVGPAARPMPLAAHALRQGARAAPAPLRRRYRASVAAEAPASAPAPVALHPLEMPPDPAPYVALRGHLDGRVVLGLAIDGNGRVTEATVDLSSGDPVLDAHALATVRGWRFAVPADRPDGLRGSLPMRFASGAHATPP